MANSGHSEIISRHVDKHCTFSPLLGSTRVPFLKCRHGIIILNIKLREITFQHLRHVNYPRILHPRGQANSGFVIDRMRFNAARKSNMAESDDEVGLVDVKVTI